MTIETVLVYESGRFTSIPLPDWLDRAGAICSDERLDWHKAVSKAIGAEHQGFTVEPTGSAGIEIGFWYSLQHGVYVEIATVLGNVDQVLIVGHADWLPFMSTHLTPLLAAVSQAETARQLDRIANALISFGRHEHGEHIDRCTGTGSMNEGNRNTGSANARRPRNERPLCPAVRSARLWRAQAVARSGQARRLARAGPARRLGR